MRGIYLAGAEHEDGIARINARQSVVTALVHEDEVIAEGIWSGQAHVCCSQCTQPGSANTPMASGATPLANGPRHRGQLRNASALGRAPASPAKVESGSRQPSNGRKRGRKIMLTDFAPLI
jgi:hypothetical protein